MFFILVIAFSCSSVRNGVADIEVINFETIIYDLSQDSSIVPALTIQQKVWRKDSLAIEEVKSLKIVSDDKGTRQTTVLEGFRFNNLRSKTVYEYKTFSDTATLSRKYFLDDSSVSIQGGWNFRFKRNVEFSKSPEHLNDTLIDRVIFKRLRVYVKNSKIFMDCYFRCDKKNTFFTHDLLLSKKVGCPLVKFLTYSPIRKNPGQSAEISFLSDSLTNEELKVFDAWEKNLKKYPVNK